MTDAVSLKEFFQVQYDALKAACKTDRDLLDHKIAALTEKLDDSIKNVARERVETETANKEHFVKLNNEAERILKSQSLSISVDKFDGYRTETERRLGVLEKTNAAASGQTHGVGKLALIISTVIATVIALAAAVAAFLPR